MNQNNCNIARDLMPLSVDGVCSESSQRFLDGHLAECQPCRNYFNGMKTGMLNIKIEPTQESKSLKKSLRHMGKRFKALWITLTALVCAFALFLVAAGVNQILWHHTAATPLDAYYISIYSNDALVSMGLSGSFYKQVYDGFDCAAEATVLPGTDQEAIILTYTLRWFPYQHKKIADAIDEDFAAGLTAFQSEGVRADVIYDGVKLNTRWKSDARFVTNLDTHQLCVADGKLYLVDGMDAVESTTGRTLIVLLPGTPVAEIRFTDGKNTKTIYTWGDEIENITANHLDEQGLPQSGLLSPSDLDKYADLIVK